HFLNPLKGKITAETESHGWLGRLSCSTFRWFRSLALGRFRCRWLSMSLRRRNCRRRWHLELSLVDRDIGFHLLNGHLRHVVGIALGATFDGKREVNAVHLFVGSQVS